MQGLIAFLFVFSIIVIIHEFGHYLARVQNIEKDRRFKQCLEEKEEALRTILKSNKYFTDDAEYFAEMFRISLQDPEGLKETAPVIFDFIDNIKSNI